MPPLTSLFGQNSDVLRQRNLQVILLANTVGVMGVTLLSPIMDSLVEPVGATTQSIGLLISVYTAPAILVIPISGFLADRYGRKPVLGVGLLLFGVAGTSISLVDEFHVILLLRFIQGIGAGGLTPIITTTIGDSYSGPAEDTAQGFRLVSSGVSSTIFPVVAGVVVGIAWYAPFYLYALAILCAILVVRFFDEPEQAVADGDGPTNRRHVRKAVYELLRKPYVIATLTAFFVGIMLYIAYYSYISVVILRAFDGSVEVAGFAVAIYSITYAISASQVGRFTEFANSRLGPLLAANIVMGIGFLGIIALPLFEMFAGIVVFGIGAGVTASLYRSLLTGFVSRRYRATFIGIAESQGRVAATISPILVGLLIGLVTPSLGEANAILAVWAVFGAVGTLISICCVLVVMRTAPGDMVDY